ncbi:uncharacterized protein LOC119212782 [Pungitius pungitius]|uniref:uncharacterized protein LOC119212782 n=1 Tax=Pungitius pungitius TaxID=134920 RepID=UPI002E15907F
MRAMQRLLLLAEFVLLARCQKLQVDISPQLEKIFLGDLIRLRCDSSNGSEVKWYMNGTEQNQRSHTLKIEVATLKHSGIYQCERGTLKSDDYPITVQDYVPKASLTIRTGQPVVRKGGSVILQLDHEDGVKGWKCWVNTGEQTQKVPMRRSLEKAVRVVFQTHRLEAPESVFWCTGTQQLRSNQILVRTSVSEQYVALEMYPLPAVVGESLTLKCLVWGAERIIRAVFYKDTKSIQESQQFTYHIDNVTDSTGGRYKCEATYTYKQHSAGPPYQVFSDEQNVFVQVSPMRAVLVSAGSSMSCSCLRCRANGTYHWYIYHGEGWLLMSSRQRVMTPEKSGTYACRMVWTEGRSALSNVHIYQSKSIPMSIVVILVLLVVVGLGVCFCFIIKRRNTTDQVYEDVPLRSRDTADGGYDVLKKRPQGEGEYDTLQPGASGEQPKEGEYQALKKGEATEYDTLQPGASGEQAKEGEYQALKKGEATEYDTLQPKAPGEQAKEGEYQALKKGEASEYDTLQPGASGEQAKGGEYEALKKGEATEGVYHTLGMGGAEGGE